MNFLSTRFSCLWLILTTILNFIWSYTSYDILLYISILDPIFESLDLTSQKCNSSIKVSLDLEKNSSNSPPWIQLTLAKLLPVKAKAKGVCSNFVAHYGQNCWILSKNYWFLSCSFLRLNEIKFKPKLKDKTSDARYFIVKIKCHCDFTIVFWANLYFIFQILRFKKDYYY